VEIFHTSKEPWLSRSVSTCPHLIRLLVISIKSVLIGRMSAGSDFLSLVSDILRDKRIRQNSIEEDAKRSTLGPARLSCYELL
jgi:hypothetical protein